MAILEKRLLYALDVNAKPNHIAKREGYYCPW